ncbi:MAG: hypothetical protein O3C61_07100 [Proteobacteria bacterium]|nr:hypothetical protein [Pseudomonadota bacterium]
MKLSPIFKFFFINFETKKIDHMPANDPLENYDKLTEVQQLEAEQLIMDKAFRNSFLIVSKKKTFNQVMKSKDGIILAHDPHLGITEYEVENMMQYFSDEEEYEKCAIIRDLYPKKKWNIR